MSGFFVLHDCVDSSDPQGRTIKEVNLTKVHSIPMGSLVECLADPRYPSHTDGVRLFVALQGRDCDGTPLYWLSPYSDDLVQEDARFANHKWIGGFPEDSLEVIRLPDGSKPAPEQLAPPCADMPP